MIIYGIIYIYIYVFFKVEGVEEMEGNRGFLVH